MESWNTDLEDVRQEMRMQLDRLPNCDSEELLDFSASVTFNFPQNEVNGYEPHPQTEYWVYTDPNGDQCAQTTYYTFPRVSQNILPSGSVLRTTEYETTNINWNGPDERAAHMDSELFSLIGGDFTQKLFATDVDGDGAVDQISDTGDLGINNWNITSEDYESGLSLQHVIDYRKRLFIEAVIRIETELMIEMQGGDEKEDQKRKGKSPGADEA